jgi:hypothetical protein
VDRVPDEIDRGQRRAALLLRVEVAVEEAVPMAQELLEQEEEQHPSEDEEGGPQGAGLAGKGQPPIAKLYLQEFDEMWVASVPKY